MKYKLLASDLDGTLLNSQSIISPENIEAIKKLTELGILFVPSTGRAYSELADELRTNDAIRYYICSGGAVTYDKLTGEKLGEYIPSSCLSEILSVLAGFEHWKIMHYDNYTYVQQSEITRERMDHYGLHPYLRALATETARRTDDLDSFIVERGDIEMIAAVFITEEEAVACEKALSKIDGITVLRGTMGHGIHNVEAVSSRACKGSMLLKLADHLGIPYETVMSVGDSANDLSMIKAVEHSFAVSNATEDVKNAAKWVICSNNEHAISHILENYVNKG